MMTSPAYVLLNVSRITPELTIADIIFAAMILMLLTIETIADQQQWRMCTKGRQRHD